MSPSLSLKPRTPKLEQATPSAIFGGPSFAKNLRLMLGAADEQYLPVETHWRTHKRLMRVAAQMGATMGSRQGQAQQKHSCPHSKTQPQRQSGCPCILPLRSSHTPYVP